MTALSIPERAREIARQKHLEECILSAEYSHSNLECQHDIDSFVKVAEAAMLSEREQVCKELEAIAAEWIPESVTKYNLLIKAVTRLREGGQK